MTGKGGVVVTLMSCHAAPCRAAPRASVSEQVPPGWRLAPASATQRGCANISTSWTACSLAVPSRWTGPAPARSPSSARRCASICARASPCSPPRSCTCARSSSNCCGFCVGRPTCAGCRSSG
ncbi:hypothetical protein WR25_16088 [Diploscapter pachys]|uniref:Uncharacterized protein n=1 Tax=Diploscapter pachys TaxID=2018661 RepID=A0A2A2M5L6_9BILA|nr:hypothetical protein WR25_16088 [Diploscapter pachys]